MPNSPQLDIYSPYDVDMANPAFDWIRFREQMERSPIRIKEIVFDPKTAFFLRDEVAAKFALNPEQAKELSRIVRDTLLSGQAGDSLMKQIQTRLGIEPTLAENIATSVNSFLHTGDISGVHQFPPNLSETGGNIIDLRKSN